MQINTSSHRVCKSDQQRNLCSLHIIKEQTSLSHKAGNQIVDFISNALARDSTLLMSKTLLYTKFDHLLKNVYHCRVLSGSLMLIHLCLRPTFTPKLPRTAGGSLHFYEVISSNCLSTHHSIFVILQNRVFYKS